MKLFSLIMKIGFLPESIDRNNKKVNFKCQGLNAVSVLINFNIKSIYYIGLVKYFLDRNI